MMQYEPEYKVMVWLIITLFINSVDIGLTHYNKDKNLEINPIMKMFMNNLGNMLLYQTLFLLTVAFLGIVYSYEELTISGLQIFSVITLAFGIGSNILTIIIY